MEASPPISHLILPFARKGQDRKTELSNEMELAAMICIAETERVRPAVPDNVNDLVFVSKLYYPFWAVPWKKKCFLLDGMKLVAGTATLLKAPDLEAFVDNLKRTTRDQQQYFNTLRSESATFREFSSQKQLTIAGYVSDKEMLIDMAVFLEDTPTILKSYPSELTSSIPPRIDKEEAVRTANEVVELYDELQAEAKGLQYALEMLTQERQAHAGRLQQELQQTQTIFDEQITDLTKKVAEKTTQLENDCNSELAGIARNHNKRIEDIAAEKHEMEKQLLRLERDKNEYEERRDIRKSKKDKPREIRWKVRLGQVAKQISKVKEKIRSFQNLITKIQKETEKSSKKVRERYTRLVDEEKKKIAELAKLRDLKIEENNAEVNELQQSTLALSSNIEALIEHVELASSSIEATTIPREIETIMIISIPLYVICHRARNGNTYALFSPVTAQQYKGLILRISASLGVSSFGSGIKSLLKPRFKTIEKLLKSFKGELEKDEKLEATVNKIGMANNLINVLNFKEKLERGLGGLEKEGWISPEERKAVSAAYRRN